MKFGLPKWFKGIIAFIQVLKDRINKSITDEMVKENKQLNDCTDSYQRGRIIPEAITKNHSQYLHWALENFVYE